MAFNRGSYAHYNPTDTIGVDNDFSLVKVRPRVTINGVAVDTTDPENPFLYIDPTETMAAGTDGQVQYNNGDVFGGASGLFYDDATGNVGIGTITPSEKLDVDGNIAVSGTVDGRDIATDGTKLDGLMAPNLFRATRTTFTESLTVVGTQLPVQWESILTNEGDFTHSTTVNPSRIYVTDGGTVTVQANIIWDSAALTTRATVRVSLYVNGVEKTRTRVYSYNRGQSYTSPNLNALVVTTERLSAGDYIEIIFRSTHVDTATTVTTSVNSQICLTRIREI